MRRSHQTASSTETFVSTTYHYRGVVAISVRVWMGLLADVSTFPKWVYPYYFRVLLFLVHLHPFLFWLDIAFPFRATEQQRLRGPLFCRPSNTNARTRRHTCQWPLTLPLRRLLLAITTTPTATNPNTTNISTWLLPCSRWLPRHRPRCPLLLQTPMAITLPVPLAICTSSTMSFRRLSQRRRAF